MDDTAAGGDQENGEVSGFSFLTAPSASDHSMADLMMNDAPTNPPPDEPAALEQQTSAFSFLSSQGTARQGGEEEEPDESGAEAPSLSAFSFLSNSSNPGGLDNDGSSGSHQQHTSMQPPDQSGPVLPIAEKESSGFAFLSSYNGHDDVDDAVPKEGAGEEEHEPQAEAQETEEGQSSSAFSFIPVATVSSSAGNGGGYSPMKAKEEEAAEPSAAGEDNAYSAFNFLSSSSAELSPPPPPPLPTLPTLSSEPDLLNSGMNSSSSSAVVPPPASSSSSSPARPGEASRPSDLLSTLEGLSLPTSTSSSSIAAVAGVASSEAPGRRSAQTSWLSESGGGGRSSGGNTPIMTSGPITFEKTATSRTNIKKKKTTIKVGYARDGGMDASGGGQPPASSVQQAQPSAPATPLPSSSSSSSIPVVIPDMTRREVPTPPQDSVGSEGAVGVSNLRTSGGSGTWCPSSSDGGRGGARRSDSSSSVESLPAIVSTDAASTPV